MDKPLPPSEPDKQTQKAILKRHVDPAGPMLKYIQNRCSLALRRSSPWLQPTMAGALQLLPPEAYPDVPTSSLTTRFVASTQNKTRCPVFCTRFAPDSRRVLTGDSAGGISVWNSQDFGYMQYLQVHNKGVRDINFTHNGNFVLAADDTGAVKISSINLKPLQEIAAHELRVSAVSPSPTDQMFASCSDDNTVKVWDLATGTATTFAGRTGHGGEVKSVDWHPCTSLLASCGRDAMVKLWDARLSPDTAMLATLSGHKQAVNKVCWNLNGTWLASCSRDFTVKVWDVRHTKREMVSWQGHQGGKDITAVAWHPIHLDLLASTGADSSIVFWLLGQSEALTKIEIAHENQINGLAFHPMGHKMTTCAVDGVSKFWVRPRPGDPWKDSTQQEQEEYTALLAKTLPGGQAAQLPGLSGPSTAAGRSGNLPSKLPGGINIQVPGQQQGGHAAGQASPASASMGPAPPDGRIPGLPLPRSMPVPPGASMAPGLTPSGLSGPPQGPAPGRGLPGVHVAAGTGGGVGGVPGLAPGGQAAAGGMAGRGQGGMGRGVGRGRGRGPPLQPVHGGVKRPRESYDAGYDMHGGAAAGAAAGVVQQHYPGPPHKQQQHFPPQMQQHHGPRPPQHPPPPQHFAQQQQHVHQQQQHHVAHPPQRPQFGAQGFGGGPQVPGRGFGAPDAGRGPGRGQFSHPGGRGEFGGRMGGRGYGRGFGRGRHH